MASRVSLRVVVVAAALFAGAALASNEQVDPCVKEFSDCCEIQRTKCISDAQTGDWLPPPNGVYLESVQGSCECWLEYGRCMNANQANCFADFSSSENSALAQWRSNCNTVCSNSAMPSSRANECDLAVLAPSGRVLGACYPFQTSSGTCSAQYVVFTLSQSSLSYSDFDAFKSALAATSSSLNESHLRILNTVSGATTRVDVRALNTNLFDDDDAGLTALAAVSPGTHGSFSISSVSGRLNAQSDDCPPALPTPPGFPGASAATVAPSSLLSLVFTTLVSFVAVVVMAF